VFGLDMEDVIQETYTRILSGPPLESIQHPKEYAVQTARGIVIDYLRRSRVVSIIGTGHLDTLSVPMREANAEERLEFQEEVDAVVDVLARMPEKLRQTLLMRRVEGLSQKEVARRLKVSESSVERYLAESVRVLVTLFGRGGKGRANSSTMTNQVGAEDVVDKPRS